MKIEEVNIEQLLMNESFIQFCNGTNADSLAFWQQWYIIHPDSQHVVDHARNLYLSINGGNDADQFFAHRCEFLKKLKENGII